jgi:alkylhydroperoxidase family enzyme
LREKHRNALPEARFGCIAGRNKQAREGRMARFPYLNKEDVAPEHRAHMRDINLTRVLFHNPELARVSNEHAMYLRNRSRLDPRLREMAILQVGYCARSPYEYSHHVKIGMDFGVSEADIRAIADETAGRPTNLEPLAKTVLKAARELANEIKLSDETFAVLKQNLATPVLLELIDAICSYCGTVRMLAALQIDVEDEYKPYLDKFPLPKG